MCLLKVYLKDEKMGKRLIARDVVFTSKEGGTIKLRDLNLKETTLENVDIISIDALNSVQLLESK